MKGFIVSQPGGLSEKYYSDLEKEFMVTRGKGQRRGIVREFGIDMCTLLYLKCTAQGTLLNTM